MSYRLGVDVGGTFTDLLLIDEQGGATFTAKSAVNAGRLLYRRAERHRPHL